LAAPGLTKVNTFTTFTLLDNPTPKGFRKNAIATIEPKRSWWRLAVLFHKGTVFKE
jgi:hypothetical protein